MTDRIVLKDGVRYRLWTPENELNDFEPMIKHHIRDIFGDDCRYFPKRKLKTLAGNRSIPDGFVIDFKNQRWYIVELKLLCDDAVRRIPRQIVDYKNAIKNPKTRRNIYKSIKSINRGDFLDELINDKNPEIVVIINSLDGKLGEQFRERVEETWRNVKIIVFKTFAREYVNPKRVHMHLFEPVYEVPTNLPLPLKEKGESIVGEEKEIKVEKIIPIGAKGNQIIKVINKMEEGKEFNIAVREVSKELGIKYSSVADKCGRQLGISTKDFVEMVKKETIYDHLYNEGAIKSLESEKQIETPLK
ncbi:MAG: hypothetical protein B6U72_06390 [Candidatus Altiarchaeales archaeon ex4484_2]|nr:MAG: hypothetical protein B6U72_06390 [Candidatus Altiarchaeales archaeon ex4484_2]